MRILLATIGCRMRYGLLIFLTLLLPALTNFMKSSRPLIPIMLQDGTAAEGDAEDPKTDSVAAAEKPAKKSKQAPAAPILSSELPDQGLTKPKSSKASRLVSSTLKQEPAPVLAPPSEVDAEADVQSESEAESEEEDEAEAEASKRWARMRGLAGSESSSEEEDASDSDTDAELPAGADDEEVKSLLRAIESCACNALDNLASLCKQPFQVLDYSP